jgi:hypothetical protein
MATYDFPHKGRAQTARWMYLLAEKFAGDIGDLGRLPLVDMHKLVGDMPYKSDDRAWRDPFREVVARPKYILEMLKNKEIGGIDCKKKAILLGSWATLNGIPWELIAMSERPDKEIHHVFPLLGMGGNWVNADATYAKYQLGGPKPEITNAERLFR